MFLRRCYRKKDGKRHGYWALEAIRLIVECRESLGGAWRQIHSVWKVLRERKR